ncbi:MAG: hypothetical protein ACKO6B_15625 [Planctomycetia bacterium]
MHRSRCHRFFGVLGVLISMGLVTMATTGWPLGAGSARAIDAEAVLPVAAHGTRFHFEVIESTDAKYLGDTPAHRGKDGGLTVRPQVALGDAVYRTVGNAEVTIGRITRIEWNRVSGSLEIEFSPEPLQRIAVGDEAWIDLNPQPRAGATSDTTGSRL